jgi:hypothetical protein
MDKPLSLVPQTTNQQPGFEGELRDILRRADKRELRQDGGAPFAAPHQNPTELVRRVAGTTTEQVERVVLQLQSLSELLQNRVLNW